MGFGLSIPTDQITRFVSPRQSIRHDYDGVKRRVVGRGGNISAKEFEASFPIGIEILADRDAVPSLTVHHHKKSSGNPLFTLVVEQPDGIPLNNQCILNLDDLKYRPAGIAAAVSEGEAVPIRRLVHGKPESTVVYAIRPGENGVQAGPV